jgi:hypothetical protein
VLTGSADSCAMVATTALESTPPERKAPRGTSEMSRKRTDSRSRVVSSAHASSRESEFATVKRTSQYSRGAGNGWPRRMHSVCAGGSLRACLKMQRGSAT